MAVKLYLVHDSLKNCVFYKGNEALKRKGIGMIKDIGESSDGYHTFNELYDHRNLLFINLCLQMPDKAHWKEGYPGWPVLFLELPVGQISYHVQEKYLPLFEKRIRRDDQRVWDGHTSPEVVNRLNMQANYI